MRPTKTSGSHTSAKFTESGIRCITYAPRCISNVSHMPHLEKFIRDETSRIYPRYLDQIPLFGQTRAIGCRHLRALDCHSSARIRGSRLEKTVNFYFLIVYRKKKKTKKKLKRRLVPIFYRGTKERHQRILHVPPSVIRRNRNQPRRQAPN